jgi:hypothetical protein
MSWARPNYIDSPYFYYDEDGIGRLREGAPQDIVDEYNGYIEGHYEETYGPQQPEARALTDDDLRDL